jgi:hypothetical protein
MPHAPARLLRNLAIGAGAGGLCGVLEIALRTGGDPWLGTALAFALCGAAGATSALVVDLLGERRVLCTALLLLPGPLAGAGMIHWGMGRAADLSLWVGAVAVWIAALAVAAGCAVAVFVALGRAMRAQGDRRRVRAVAAAVAFLLPLAPCLDAFQGRAPLVARIVLHALALGAAAVALSSWHRRIVLPAIAAVCGAALVAIPARYTGLMAAAAGVTVGSLVLSAEAWNLIAPHRPRRPAWIAAALAAASLLVLCSHLLVARFPGSWTAAGGRGLLSVLVRAGRALSDFDRDGHGEIFAQGDCAPFDASISPGAHEIPGNGVDENCLAGPQREDPCGLVRAAEAINPRPRPWTGDAVVVLVDTLRYDDSRGGAAPNMAAFARSGVGFTRAYSMAPFTAFALLGLFSGRLAPNVSTTWYGMQSGVTRMPEDSLAPALARAGYATAMVADARLDRENYTKGFGTVSLLAPITSPSQMAREAERVWRSLPQGVPRFLWVHFMSLHEPQREHSRYLVLLRKVDAAIGELRALVGNEPMWVLLADHGEEFEEHGGLHHASSLYEEQVHVPLVVARPDLPPRIETHVSALRSLYPTLAAMIVPGLAPEGKGPYLCVDGEGCRDVPVPMALEMQNVHLHGLVLGSRKIVRDVDRDDLAAFDLSADPLERRRLAAVPPELEASLVTWEERLFGPRDGTCFWPYEARR